MFKKVYIEITNHCNLNCSFCNGTTRVKGFMSDEQFDIILDKLKGYTKYLYFHVMGEPLLHPCINDFINKASENYHVNITSNGYFINRIKNNKNIRQINISLHSFDLKYGKSLEEYMNHILDNCKNMSQNDTIINYRLWVNSEYKNEIISILEKYYSVNIGNKKKAKLDHMIFYEVEEEFIWPNLDNDSYHENGSCRGTRDHLGILVDGTVVPCCLDSNGIIHLGNIYKQDLNDIINGKLFKEIHQGFLNNKKVHELCRKCNFYDLRR